MKDDCDFVACNQCKSCDIQVCSIDEKNDAKKQEKLTQFIFWKSKHILSSETKQIDDKHTDDKTSDNNEIKHSTECVPKK